ncbi:MAG: hypothetical protein ACNA8N_15605, partial [Trueperaceae bacterium]
MRARRLLAALALAATASLAWAWTPERFEVFCGWPAHYVGGQGPAATGLAHYADGRGGADFVTEADCLTPERKAWIERSARTIMAAYRNLGFADPSPDRLGPVVGTGADQAVRIYVHERPTGAFYADTLAPCLASGAKDLGRLSIVSLNTEVARTAVAPKLYYILAHELFHVVQNAQRFKVGEGTRSCLIDPWVAEGTADAIATHLTRQMYPAFDPPLGAPWVRNYVGLRPYDVALTAEASAAREGVRERVNVLAYRASSFWRHLVETHLRDDWRVLARFLAQSNDAGGRDDWLRWADRLLRAERQIRLPMPMAFADFLTDYATWGEAKYGRSIGGEAWLREAFGGCSVVSLNPRQPLRFVTLELEPHSGACIRVVVGGLQSDALAAVRVVARDPDVDRLDQLHLGLATSTAFSRLDGLDFDGFDCHDYLRGGGPRGSTCTFNPFVGVEPNAATDEVVKTWRSGPQRPRAGHGFENLYVVTRAPLDPRDARHRDRTRQTVRLAIGLETAALNTPATARAPAVRRPAAVVGGAEVPFSPMSDPPVRTEVPAAPGGIDPAMFSRFASGAMRPMPDLDDGRLRGLTVSWGGLAPDTADDRGFDVTFQLQIAFDEYLPGGLPAFGVTGTYPAWVMGYGDASAAGFGVADEAGLARMLAGMASRDPAARGFPLCNYPYMPKPQDPDQGARGFRWFEPPDDAFRMGPLAPAATVEFLAFDANLLHVRFSGTLGYADEDADEWALCLDPQPFEGEAILPLGAIRTGGGLNLVQTPGTEQQYGYRMGFLFGYPDEDDLPDLEAGVGAGGGSGGGPGSGGGSGGGGAVLEPACDCSCDALLSIVAVMEDLDDDDDDLPPDVMEALQCVDTCGMGAMIACMM